MDKLEKLNNLKINAFSLIKSAAFFMRLLQPLNNPEFMNPTEKQMYDSYLLLINNFNDEYDELYETLTEDERRNHEHMNVLVEFNSAIKRIDCIEMVYDSDDEYSLKEKFSKAYKYGMKAIKDKIEAEKRDDRVTILDCNRILAACNMIFKKYYWGESYQRDLDQYEERLRSGRTDEDDLEEYQQLFDEAIDLSIEYAHAMIKDEPYEVLTEIYKRYEPLFAREEKILRYIPITKLESIKEHNLHWLRLQVQSNPRLFLQRYGENTRTK